MARKPNKGTKGEPFRLHLIIPGEIAAKIDATVALFERRSPGLRVTRSDVVRQAIYSFISKPTNSGE